MAGKGIVDVIKQTKDLTPKDRLNGITLEDATIRIVDGDYEVIPHIKTAVKKLGGPTVQHNVANEVVKEANERVKDLVAKKVPKEVAIKRVQANIKKLKPNLVNAFVGKCKKINE